MTLRELIEDFKAWRRGERRIAPYGQTGRIYERKDGGGDLKPVEVAATPTVELNLQITRADGTVEDVSVPVEVVKNG